MIALHINGDLGSKIGTISKHRDIEPVYKAGRIELWHNDNLVVSQNFDTIFRRKEIIKLWYHNYQLLRKTNVFFQIIYDYRTHWKLGKSVKMELAKQ